MTRLLLWVAMFAVAIVVTGRATRYLAVASPLHRVNYRGLSVPTGAGVAVILGLLVAAGLATFLWLLDGTGRLAEARSETLVLAIAAAGFGVLGLWDDIAGRAEERGWRAHLTAVRHGKATAGAIKLVGGGSLALSIAAVRGESLGWTVVGALVIALSANAFNLLDVRPGRSTKWFLVAIVAVLFAPGPSIASLAAAAGAGVAFLPFDLRERAMLGNCGAMALGGMAGWAFVSCGHMVELVALVVLAAMHVAGDKPGLSHVIEVVAPLRIFDRAGRVPE